MMRNSTGFFALLAVVVMAGFSGCASVESTSAYYLPYTAKYYPPKPPDAPIPILGKAPAGQPYTAIGKLAFETDLGWKFLRKSMIYNAQQNGADAVILKNVSRRKQVSYVQVPPQIDWVPAPSYYQKCRNGRVYSYTNWVPIYQPGYVQPMVDTITGIDSEMVVFKK